MRVGCSLIEGRGKQPRFVLGHRTTGDNGAELLGKEMRRTEDSNTDREIPRNLPLRYRGWQPNGKTWSESLHPLSKQSSDWSL